MMFIVQNIILYMLNILPRGSYFHRDPEVSKLYFAIGKKIYDSYKKEKVTELLILS